MPQGRKRYVITHREQIVAPEQAAALLEREPARIESFLSAAKPLSEETVVHFPQIGVSYAWLTEEEASLLSADPRISSVREQHLVASGGQLISIEPPAAGVAHEFSLGPPPAEAIPWNIRLVGADLVWPRSTGRGIKVAVLDNGINKSRNDLTVAGGISFVPNITDWDDDDGHGTHCAGIIAARAAHEKVIGVAYDCSLYAVKVMSHGRGSTDSVVAGLMWAADNKVDVASLSLWNTNGADAPDEPFWDDIERAAQYAFKAGCFVVGISGNSGDRAKHWVTNPGRCPGVMAVGAIDQSKTWWAESSYGPPELPVEQVVEVTAPGVMVRSTHLGNSFATYNGTSQACPHVAGAAALIKAVDPSLGPAQIRARLRDTADDLGPPGRDEKFGSGLLNCIKSSPTGATRLGA